MRSIIRSIIQGIYKQSLKPSKKGYFVITASNADMSFKNVMKASQVREKYLKFFEERGHKRIAPAPLVLENDPTTLFTSSGMQPLVPYLMGQPHPEGKRLVNSQPSIRLQDIDEVGDGRHTTFFEMLGNWSLGDYFKKEQLAWCWEFFTRELGLPQDRLWVSIFEGTKEIPKDTESSQLWKSLGVSEGRICPYGVEKNWWSRSGTPKEMPVGEIGGPDSEVFYDFGTPHDPKYGKDCHPNCECGRFLEIGNSVFMQYKKIEAGKLEELSQRNVDFGAGLERCAAAVNNNPDVFQIDLFQDFIESIESQYGVSYGRGKENDRSMRIIADHLRASAMLISGGVLPSNKAQGYVLRRLVRRAVFHISSLQKGYVGLPQVWGLEYNNYPVILKSWHEIAQVIDREADKFTKTLDAGLKKLKHRLDNKNTINGKFIFDLYQTEGFPLELSLEILSKEGIKFPQSDREEFKKEFERHKELSRSGGLPRLGVLE